MTTTTTVIDLALQYPPQELHPNERYYDHQRWKAQREYKEACHVDALNAKRGYEARGVEFPLAVPVLLTVTFCTDRRKHDWDNLVAAFKHGQDGALVLSGILPDDSIKEIERVTYEWAYGAPAVLVRIEAAGG